MRQNVPVGVGRVGILDGLAEPERRELLAQMHRRRFAKGDIVFHEGDPGDTLHLIVRGHVSVQVNTPRGDRAVLRVLGAGSLVGEFAVLSTAPRSATVTALNRVETMALGAQAFAELRAERADLDVVLLDLAIGEVRRLSTALLDAMYLPAEQRVLRKLVEMAELFADGDADRYPTVVVPLAQDDLASMAGVSRQSANKVLAKVQAASLVALRRGSIEILDVDALIRRAG